MISSLPSLWRAALEDIADGRPGAWRGVATLPGGSPVALAMEAVGVVEFVAADRRYVTLTPFGAALIGVGLFEWEDCGEPCWLPLRRIAALERGDRDAGTAPRPLVSQGERGVVYRGMLDRLECEPAREWYADQGPPQPAVTEFDVPIGIGLEGDGTAAMAYRESDIKRYRAAEARRRRDEKKAAKRARLNRRSA